MDELQAAIPKDRREQLAIAARVLGPAVAAKVPFAQGVRALSNDPLELLINSTWRATLAVTGADGLPAVQSAGNVLLPEISLKLSLRLPPRLRRRARGRRRTPGARARSSLRRTGSI